MVVTRGWGWEKEMLVKGYKVPYKMNNDSMMTVANNTVLQKIK